MFRRLIASRISNLAMIWRLGIVRNVLLLAIVSVIGGCAENSVDPIPAPTETLPSSSQRAVLRVFSPRDGTDLFNVVLSVQDTASLPYELQILEGPRMDKGVEGVQNGLFDVMIISRKLTAEDGLKFSELFHAPAGFYVNPDVGLTDLTTSQVNAIFSGEVTNWAELGGADLDVVVCIQDDEDPSTYSLREFLFGQPEFSRDAEIYDTEYDILLVVEAVPGAIGYASRSGELYYEFIQGREFLNPVSLDGLNPDDPGYMFTSTVGYAYLPENEAYLQPLIDMSYAALESPLVKGLMERFGVFRSVSGGEDDLVN